MNMQQMVQSMQKLQRQYEKEHKLLEEKEFTYTANSAIKLTLKGDMTFVSLEFLDKDILDKENADIISDMIKLAYDHIKEEINKAEEEIASKFKVPGGFGF
ncbi:MAG TPA: hypothetical protein DEA28_03495 [Firmicutes bacterium]|nr:hypothetical protein [Clostridiales bacterium]HBS10768.1 hypothetical protein [Bacillota bacterium]